MKYIKLYEESDELDKYFSDTFSPLEDLKRLCIENYTINDDFSVDVNGDVNLSGKLYSLEKLSLRYLPIKFRNVYGTFDCSNNSLLSLDGCPNYIDGDFLCHRNKLKNLVGGPVEVTGFYYCSNSGIESLEGMALEIGTIFNCLDCNISELDSISNVEGNIYCNDNVDLTKFKGYCKGIVTSKKTEN